MADLSNVIDNSGIAAGEALNSAPVANNFTALVNALTGVTGSFDVDITGSFTAGQVNGDNIRIDGNIISSTNTDGDINITPNGSGQTVIASLDNTPIGANTASTGDFTTISTTGNAAIGGGVATDGKEAVKFDVISGSYSVSDGSQTVTIAHGKSTNIRGVSSGYLSGSNVGGGVTGTAYITSITASDTNVYISIGANGTSSSGTVYVTVFYV